MRTYKGSCHCGAVRFEVESELRRVGICNCSICLKRNAVMLRVPAEHFHLLAGEEALQLYQFNTRTARHYFCKTCGTYPFHRPRLAPEAYAVNVFCLEGVDRAAVARLEVVEFDGRGFSTV